MARGGNAHAGWSLGSEQRDSLGEETAAIAALEKLGATVVVDDAGHAQAVVLPGLGVADSDLGHLLAMPQLTGVTIPSRAVTPEGLRIVAQLAHLERLGLQWESLDEENVRALNNLRSLREVCVYAASATERGICESRLRLAVELRHLTDLLLSTQAVTDSSLRHLRQARSLRCVALFGTAVTDAGVKRLQRALPECQITWGDPDPPTGRLSTPPVKSLKPP